MQLVIVESPAKCSKIQGYLGPGFKVIATMGHIRALEESLDAIGIARDFEARYEFLSSKAKALKQLKDSAKGADKIYLASDDDREGEAISYSVCLYLRLNPKTTPRIVFHEITEKAIKHAVANPRYLDMNRTYAQQARSILDMMIGFTMSPLLWKHVAPGLSAGRCQTPALRIVVEREDEILQFKKASSWRVHGNWSPSPTSLSTSLSPPPSPQEFSATLDDELEDEESAINYLELLQESAATIQSSTIKAWTSNPPLPLITSTLQQQASALYSISPKATMQSAQRLYEGGHITYMRTDMAIVSEEAKAEIRAYIQTAYGDKYVGTEHGGQKARNRTKVSATKEAVAAQEAHECIRPTHIDVEKPEGEWSAYDMKIYRLIWQRALQSQMAAASGEQCTVAFTADACADFPWTAACRRTLFQGWMRVGRVADLESNELSEEDSSPASAASAVWESITSLLPESKITWNSLTTEPHETKAIPRFSEATLIRELESHGIGRPSTFASLVATIQEKVYVEVKNISGRQVDMKIYTAQPSMWPPAEKIVKRAVGQEKHKLVPTELGRSALAFMLLHFGDLFEYTFTSGMEKRLDAISEGKEEWKNILRDMWNSYKERYDTIKGGPSSPSSPSPALPLSLSTSPSPRIREFSNGLKAVMTKKGPVLLIEGADKKATFYGWPKNVPFQDITEERAREVINEKISSEASIGAWNGYPICKKSGKFGPYVQAGDTIVSISAEDTVEQIYEKLNQKIAHPPTAARKIFKEYEIHDGKFGPYIIKPALKARKFVSVPKGITIEALTEKEVEALYRAGAEAKAKYAKYRSEKK